MQSLTSRSSNRRRFMRLAGTGATALLAAGAVASAAGAATAPSPMVGPPGPAADPTLRFDVPGDEPDPGASARKIATTRTTTTMGTAVHHLRRRSRGAGRN